jgi:hypothetical protein
MLIPALLLAASLLGFGDGPTPFPGPLYMSPDTCLTLTFDDGTPDMHFLPANVEEDPLFTAIANREPDPLFTPAAAEPLEPKCNTCAVGILCFIQVGKEVKMDCCSSATIGNCVKCSVCSITVIDNSPRSRSVSE